jgi:hypothetical protein
MKATVLRLTRNMELGRRGGAVVLLSVLSLVGVLSLLKAAATPFWFDEICTVTVCRLHGAGQVWSALKDAADTNPPLYYLVARAARHVAGDDELGYRLPSVIGLLATVLCIYLFLSRRAHRLSALAGAVLVLSTALVSYVDQARPYALTIGCVAAAILAWQRVGESRLAPAVLAVALAAAVSLHYYAILVWPAFGAAEAALWICRRRFRMAVWAALVAGGLPLPFYLPLLHSLRAYYGQHFWANSQITMLRAFSAQNWLFDFGGSAKSDLGLIFATGVTATLIYFMIADAPAKSPASAPEATAGKFPIEEQVLILALLWLPLIAEFAATISRNGVNPRYMQPAIVGGALAFGCLIDRVPGAGRALILLLLVANYTLSEGEVAVGALHHSLLAQRRAAAQDVKALGALDTSGLPIVISDGHLYSPMAYYAPDEMKDRICVVVDPATAVQLTPAKSDSLDLALLVLRKYFPLRVESYDSFIAKHEEFLLVLDEGPGDWWPARLARGGFNAELVSPNAIVTHYRSGGSGSAVYKVTVLPRKP